METIASLTLRIAELEARLQESEDTLEAIRRGDVDAVDVSVASPDHRVYTLENADQPYRFLVEQIQEGAVTLSPDGTIFYCNRRLAAMLHMPQERIIGRMLGAHVPARDRPLLQRLLEGASRASVRAEMSLLGPDGREIPVSASLSTLQNDEQNPLLCGVLATSRSRRPIRMPCRRSTLA